MVLTAVRRTTSGTHVKLRTPIYYANLHVEKFRPRAPRNKHQTGKKLQQYSASPADEKSRRAAERSARECNGTFTSLLQVKAKNQFKSKERSSRARFNRKYELTEKIECRSLAGRFDPSNGRLIVEANAKRASTTGDFAVMIGNICRICIGPTNAAMKAGGDADGRMMIDNCETGGECSMKMEQT
jgi:hypothetical protein